MISAIASQLAEHLKVDSGHVSDSVFCTRIEERLNHPVISLEAAEGTPLFSNEELSILRCKTDEHIMIANFTPKLRDLCREAGLEFVNTEEWEWIQVQHGKAGNEMKPDGSSSLPGLFIPQRVAPNMEDIRDPTGNFFFGQPVWKVRDMYFIWEFKCHITPRDRGKAYSNLSHLSHDDKVNIYTCVLGDNDGFVCTTMQRGVVLTNEAAPWTMTGSKQYLLKQLCRFVARNPWVSSLRELCVEHELKVIGFLGSGSYGRCFKVRTASGLERALKLVLVASQENPPLVLTLVSNELKHLKEELSGFPNVVKVESDSLIKVTDSEKVVAVGYLMSEVGIPLEASECQNRETLKHILSSLMALHREGYYHGDARLTNVLRKVGGGYMWIDFMVFGVAADFIGLQKEDMRSLIASVFGSSACAKVARVLGVAGNYSAVPEDIEAIVLSLCEV